MCGRRPARRRLDRVARHPWAAAVNDDTKSGHHGAQRLRPLLDRHRPVELAHRRADAGGRALFAERLQDEGLLDRVARVRAELFGSLGATGHGHGTDKAVLLGLEGSGPSTVDPTHGRRAPRRRIRATQAADAARRQHEIAFDEATDLVLHRAPDPAVPPQRHDASRRSTPTAPTLAGDDVLLGRRRLRRRRGRGRRETAIVPDDDRRCAHPFRTGDELLRATARRPACRSPR